LKPDAVRAVTRAMAMRDWNAADLARAAGLTIDTVADFLGARRFPRASSLSRLERALDMEPGSLLAIATNTVSGSSELPAVEQRATGTVNPPPTGETVGPVTEADDFVATGSGGTKGISNEEVLARLRRMRQELEEIERGMTGDGA
jgi:transcriptional regulator with XRE-family HTH domain